jgi:hypothetical protein
VDKVLSQVIPDAVQRFTAIYDNLVSDSPEDWSNAVHGCRRILLDLANAVQPPTDAGRTVDGKDGKPRTVKLGAGNYVNRIMAFVQDRSSSQRFSDIVGSQLAFREID